MKGIRKGALAMAAVAALCVTGCGIQAGGIGEEGGASGDLKGLEASEGSQAQEAGGQADMKCRRKEQLCWKGAVHGRF